MLSYWKQRQSGVRSGVLRLSVLALSLSVFVACAAFYRGHLSVPETDGKWQYDWHYESDDLVINLGAANFQEEGGRIWVGPITQGSNQEARKLEYLPIWVFLQPTGEEVLVFEPLQVSVTPAGTQSSLPPALMLGPVEVEQRRPAYHHCRGQIYDRLESNKVRRVRKPANGVYSIATRVCFGLFFATDPSPDHEFTVSLKGLSLGGEPLEFPEIMFRRARYSLEASLYTDANRLRVKPPKPPQP